ncbi:hypothetical protein [Chromobacterium violaceum]|uniref:hypothetical protein n=1 Tax=Chromobacterium violaceum TaxID=536 RepID=UPI003DA86BC6
MQIYISIISIIFSSIALIFTFKKDMHRLRTAIDYRKNYYHDILSINNDASFPVGISAVGHVNLAGGIKWLTDLGEYRENKHVKYPIRIDPRSTYLCTVVHGPEFPKKQSTYGYCVQLECGRTFFCKGNLPWILSVKLTFQSLISRISSGRYGFPKSKIYVRNS